MFHKIIITAMLVTSVQVANAGAVKSAIIGGVAGAVVGGTMVSNANQRQPNINSNILTSKHDTITCVQDYYDFLCKNSPQSLTPAQYAGKYGYKILHKVSTLISNDSVYIVMEVSK